MGGKKKILGLVGFYAKTIRHAETRHVSRGRRAGLGRHSLFTAGRALCSRTPSVSPAPRGQGAKDTSPAQKALMIQPSPKDSFAF